MIKKINISENDRRTILSMHKLIVEQSGEITIQGTVTEDTETKDPYLNVMVKLHDSQDKMVGRVKTDIDGTYKMTVNDLVPGEYTLKFNYGDIVKSETINVGTDTTTFTVDTTLKVKYTDMGEVKVEAKKNFIPIFNIKVVTPSGENIDGAEIEIYYKDILIDYGTFAGTSNETKTFVETNFVDNQKTLSDGLKNIWIDSTIYPYFISTRLDTLCGYKLPIKIVAKYQNVRVEKVVDTCLNNGEYLTSTDDTTKKDIIKLKIKQPQDFVITLQPPQPLQPRQKSVETKQATKVKYSKVNYSNIGFRELIKKSTDENKPAFILFTREVDMLSNDLITKLNTNEETISRLNENFIPVNYVNDESDEEGFYSAADSLDISATPAIVIIQGNPDTRPNNTTPRPFKGSYTVIKKVIDLKSYFSNFKDYLSMANDLLK
jgi:5-hydroxyisourate hydrolase-like protein (transthyretin family)